MPSDELDKFNERYNRLGVIYPTLAVGEGAMHDYAHNKRNKHLSWLFSKSKHEHFHFILPGLATPSNLESLLNHFDGDLTPSQQQEILSGFESYTTNMSIERVLEFSKIHEYVTAAVSYEDFYAKKLMPLLNELLTEFVNYEQAKNEQKKLPLTMKVGDRTVNAKEAFDIVSNFLGHIAIIIKFGNKLGKLPEQKDGEFADNAPLIQEFNKLFEQASSIPLPNMLKLSPKLYNELADNFPFIDAGINDFYMHIKEQLSRRLNTSELVFTPKEAELSDYDKAITILNNQGKIGHMVINLIDRLAEHRNSWNPYWYNSSEKIQLIISAVLNIGKGDDLASILNDKQSELYTALNMQRLLPVTFLGHLGFYHAKSAIKVDSEMERDNRKEFN